MYAIVQNNQIVEFPIYNLNQRFPNSSFPSMLTDADLPVGVVRVHVLPAPAYNQATHKPVQSSAPVFASGRWEISHNVVALDPAEAGERLQVASQDARVNRDQLLANSDWTQVADAPVDKAAWAMYRQALRDVTKQSGFPFSIVWPEQPK